jgi:hypothetical protein
MPDLAASLRRLIRSPEFKFFLIAFLILLITIPMLLAATSSRRTRWVVRPRAA